MWRSLVLASLVQGSTIGTERIGELASPEGIDALAATFPSPTHLSRALDARLHTLRLQPDAAIAAETLQLMSPLAERVGLERTELDDASFRVLQPHHHARLSSGQHKRKAVAHKMANETEGLLTAMGLPGDLTWRTKSAYSTWKKMERKGLAAHEVLDRIALRVVVDNQEACHSLVSELHGRYPAVAGSTKDYIRQPKANGYQSLHTALHVDGEVVEFQVRTHAMHAHAESGSAAHWRYKLTA